MEMNIWLRYLVKLGADINHENKNEVTLIFNACLSGNAHLIKYLIKNGANINKECNDGMTPLFNACSNGNENIVKFL